LGSNKHYLANAGAVDVAHLLAAFEEVNGCAITVAMTVMANKGKSDLMIKVTAFTKTGVYVEPVPWASVEFFRSKHGFLTLDSAIIYALYSMDARLEDLRASAEQHK